MRSSEPIRPSSRRGASGAWNRLKPVREDVLETYGLPSKGETRLNDFKTQETYLNRIIERYMKLCALNREQLDRLFASVSEAKIVENDLASEFSSLAVSKPGGLAGSRYASPSTTTTTITTPPDPASQIRPSIDELATVLQSLRKLREAITSSARTDPFARRAYFFSIHVAILCADWESYVPALHTLLSKFQLPPHDLRHFVGLQILDQACRQQDYAGARATKVRFGFADKRVEKVLACLVADDWVGYWRVRRSVDGYQRGVMEWADGRVRVHALKCLGKAYMRAERGFVERAAERRWEELVGDGVGWEVDEGGWVVIRKVKGR